MLVGIMINGACMWLCGKWAINCFRHRHDGIGWMCLFGSAYNFALILKYLDEVVL